MNFRTFSEDEEEQTTTGRTDGEESMSMLSTLGGGEVQPEGEPLGMEGVGGKAKLSTSTLAIGVVIVLGVASLLGMKMTLGGTTTDEKTQAAIQDIEKFMIEIAAAEKVSAQGPLQSPTAESEKVFAQLRQDPTQHQVPPDQVEKNPFELVGIVRPDLTQPETAPTGPTKEEILAREKLLAEKLKVNTIMSGNNPRAFISNEMYSVGDRIDETIFVVEQIEQRSVVIKAVDSGNLFRLRYE